MQDPNDVLSLAKWLADSKSVSADNKLGITESLLAAGESISAAATRTRQALRSEHLAEALMVTMEAGDTLRRLQDVLIPVAEAGQMGALIDAVSFSCQKNPDVNKVAQALTTVMESGGVVG